MTEPAIAPDAHAPKGEALQLLRDVVARLSGTEFDIAFALRTSLHVCNLMGWADAGAWFSKEINGFTDASSASPHRAVIAYETWRPDSTDGIIEQVVRETYGEGDKKTSTPWVLTGGIDSILETARFGSIVKAGEDEPRWSAMSKKKLMGRVSTIVDAKSAQQCVEKLRNITFDWASKNYAALQLGDAATDIWQQHRARVDQFLGGLNLSGHVAAITGGLGSTESQRWREAMWSSRDLLHDVAEYLCDPAPVSRTVCFLDDHAASAAAVNSRS